MISPAFFPGRLITNCSRTLTADFTRPLFKLAQARVVVAAAPRTAWAITCLQLRSKTCTTARAPQAPEHRRASNKGGHASHIPFTVEQTRHLGELRQALAKGLPSIAMKHLRPFLPVTDNDPRISAFIAQEIYPFCPKHYRDQDPLWDSLVHKLVCSAHDPAKPTHVSLVSHLAMMVTRRNLRNLIPEIEALARSFHEYPFPEDARRTRSLQMLHMAMISMYEAHGYPVRAIEYFEASVPPSLWSIHIVASTAQSMSALQQPQRILALLQQATDFGLIPHKFANPFANRFLLDSFVSLEHAVIQFESIASVLRQHPKPENQLAPIDSYVVGCLLQRSSVAIKPNLAERVLDIADEFQVSLDSEAIGSLIALRRDTFEYDAALEIYHDYRADSNRPVSIGLLTQMVTVYRQLGDLSGLEQLHADALAFHSARALRITLPYAMTVIQAFVAISGWPVAKRKYQEMLMAGVPKDVVMFEYVNNEGAVSADCIKDMAAAPGQGHAVLKEEKPYRVTMDALLRDGQEKEAIDEWTNMIQVKRVRPTSLTFTPLVTHFAERRDLEGMEYVIALGKKHRVYQTSNGSRAILTSQIKAYSFAKQFDKAFHVWDAALADGVIPSRAAQSLILDACGHSRDYERLFSILGVLVQEPWGGVDVNVWTSAVEAFCRLHDLDCAVKVVSEIMPRKGLKPDVKLVRTLWSTEAKHNQPCKNKFVVGLVKRFGGERNVLKLVQTA